MKFKVKTEEAYILIEEQANGKTIRELLPSFDANNDGSYVIINLSENGLLKGINELVPINPDYKGLIVFVGIKKELLPNVDHIISLSTIHEAQEAIFLNNLENEFLKELEE
jgi:hypothetical protein